MAFKHGSFKQLKTWTRLCAQTFATKLVNFIGAEARKQLPKQIDILPGIGRKLQQGPPELPAELQPALPEMTEPFAAMAPSMMAESPMTADAPMTAPGLGLSADYFAQSRGAPEERGLIVQINIKLTD